MFADSHLASWELISDSINGEFPTQRTAQACYYYWKRNIWKSRVAKGARNETRETPPPPQMQMLDVSAANAAVAPEPAPQHSESSASAGGIDPVRKENERRSQQPHVDCVVSVTGSSHVSEII